MIPSFPSNARVAFIGDSITAANITLRHIIHAYKTTRPDSKIRFFNCGVAGGTAKFALESFDSDVAHYAPTHAVIAFGINDSYRELLAEPRGKGRLNGLTGAFEVYKASLAALIDRLKQDGVEITLCTPVPYDEYSPSPETPLPGAYALMLGYAEFVRALAKEKEVHLYDQHRVLSEVLEYDAIISPDRIHPTDHGYFVLAREFLGAQGIDIGEEAPVEDYLAKWHSYVARLRKVLAAECMIIPSFDMPTEEKLKLMTKKVEEENWGNPVFESFIRDYVKDKPHEAELYREIDRLFEEEIL